MADGSNFSTYCVKETVYGQTPVSPTYLGVPFSGFTLGSVRNKSDSANIESGRFRGKPIMGRIDVGGDHNAELTWAAFDDWLAAAMMNDWEVDQPAIGTDRLRVGETRQSFTIVGHHSDLAGTNKHRIFRGCEVSTLSIQIPTDGAVTCAFSMIGQTEEFGDLTGETFTSSASGSPFDSYTGNLKLDAVSLAIATEVSIQIDNSMKRKPTILSGTGNAQASAGLCVVTGNITVYFETSDLYQKYLDNTEVSLEVALNNAQGTYTFIIPKASLVSGQPDVSNSGSISLPLAIEANKDDTTGTNIELRRTPV